jgi:PEP-CTERM motif
MRVLPLCSLTVLLAAWPGPATADSIQIFLDGRTVFATGVIRDNNGQLFDDREQLFETATSASAAASSPDGYLASARATLSSSLSDPHHLVAAGTIDASATVPSSNVTGLSEAAALSSFNIGFFLDRPHLFDLDSAFSGTDSVVQAENFSARLWTASLFSITANSTIFDHRRASAAGLDRVRESGVLPFGEYQLLVEGGLLHELHQASSMATSHGEFSMSFDLTPTPEPASILLLAGGLAGLFAAKCRPTRSSRR